MAEKLSKETVASRLDEIPGWAVVDGKLHRELKFGNFVQAFAFMTAAAIEAEKLDHHPEWSNVYSRVNIDLVTHSADGITDLDFQLAAKMNALAED